MLHIGLARGRCAPPSNPPALRRPPVPVGGSLGPRDLRRSGPWPGPPHASGAVARASPVEVKSVTFAAGIISWQAVAERASSPRLAPPIALR